MNGPLGVTVIAYLCLVLATFGILVEAALPTFGVAGAVAAGLAVAGGIGVAADGSPWWPLLGLVVGAGCWGVSVVVGRPGDRLEHAGLIAFAGGSLLYGVVAGDIPTVVVGAGASAGLAAFVPRLSGRVARIREAPSPVGLPSLVGATAEVVRWEHGTGTIRLDGTLWNAAGPIGLTPGAMVSVASWSGLRAIVAAPEISEFFNESGHP